MPSIKELCKEHKITMTVTRWHENPNNPAWQDANHYLCILERPLTRFHADDPTVAKMLVYFSQGYGIKSDPSVSDVLQCLVMDAVTLENTGSFYAWSDELGFDTDSIKALRIYNATIVQTNALEEFFDGYESDLWLQFVDPNNEE